MLVDSNQRNACDGELVHHREEVVGAALRTRLTHAPLFVSPGHKLSVQTAVEIVLRCCRDERFMPEPTRLAHDEVTNFVRSDRDSGTGNREPGMVDPEITQ